MTRTRTNVTGCKGEALPEAVIETPASGRVRARYKGRTRGTTVASGYGHGEFSERGCAREVSPEP